jgi:O-antigen ligase
LAIGVAITSLAGIAQGIGVAPGPLAAEEADRVNGLYPHVNVLSGFLAPAVVMLIGLAAHAWRRLAFMPLVMLGSALLGMSGLAFTLSRGALLGVAGGIVVLIALLAARRQVAALMAVLLAIVIGLVVALPQLPASQVEQFERRFSQLLEPGTETGRELTFEQAEIVLRDYPLTGVGPLTFGKMTQESSPIPDIEAGREHAHNLLFETWLSVGLLGLLGVLWFISGAIVRFVRSIGQPMTRTDVMVAGWATGAVAAFAAMLVQGVGDFVFSHVELLTLLMLLGGSAYSLAAQRAPQPAPVSGPGPSVRFAALEGRRGTASDLS